MLRLPLLSFVPNLEEDNMKNEDLYKNRSFAGCIKSAFDMVSTNPTKILKATWLPSVVSAIAATFIMLTYLPDMTITKFGISHPTLTLTVMALCWLFLATASIWLISSIYRLVNGQTFKTTWKRSAIIVQDYFVVSILTGYIVSYGIPALVSYLVQHQLMAAQTAMTGSYLATILLGIIVTAICLPCVYSGTEYLVEEHASWKNILGSAYKTGWKHWGFLFTTNLMTLIVAACIGFLCLLPLQIIVGAQVSNQLGILDGDPDGAPAYFRWLLIGTSVISFTIMNYIFLWGCMVNYYVMGTIKRREEEKTAANTTTDNMQPVYE